MRVLKPLTAGITGCLLALSGATRAETRRALLVGINQYAVPPSTSKGEVRSRGTWHNLAGSVNDAQAMKEVLVARFGFERKDISVLTDGQATNEGIRRAFQTVLVDPAAPGDLAFFYYAGHGSQMLNTASEEADHLDETIVPSDAARAGDIRDKELARMFAKAVKDKRIRLTVVFDSCHSGSITRGISRYEGIRSLAPDLVHDAKDGAPAPNIIDAGVVTLAAAQDYQPAAEGRDDRGVQHGAFTAALLHVLRSAPVDEPLSATFTRVKAIMQADGQPQEPSLEANDDRRRSPLVGPSRVGGSGKPMVAVLRKPAGNEVELQAGSAVGLAEGAVLRERRQDGTPIRLRITRVAGFAHSFAIALGDKPRLSALKAGDLFELERWAAPAGSALRVHVPRALPAAEVAGLAKQVEALRESNAAYWVEDPTEIVPTHVLFLGESGWTLVAPDGAPVALGEFPSRAALEQLLAMSPTARRRPPPCDTRPCLFVRLSPPDAIANDLTGRSAALGGVEIVKDEAQAHYILAGRSRGGQAELAWVLAAATPAPDTNRLAPVQLPSRTKWFNAVDKDGQDGTVSGLVDRALQLARLRAWLKLESPPDEGNFPYHLAIERNGTILGPGAPLVEGDRCQFLLVADAKKLAGGSEQRWVYVVGIDSEGKVAVLFPPGKIGVENRFPIFAADSNTETAPEVIRLRAGLAFTVSAPFGRDSYLLLASREPIPDIQYLEQEGMMRGAGGREGGEDNPLTSFLLSRGKTRDPTRSTPTDWSSERIEVESKPSVAPRKSN